MRGDRNGKINLTKLLLNQDNGDYFDKNGEVRAGSGVEYRKMKYWKLSPKTSLNGEVISDVKNPRSYYSIDGERYPVEPITVKVIPSMLKFFCLNK
jgi:hypothetical protein